MPGCHRDWSDVVASWAAAHVVAPREGIVSLLCENRPDETILPGCRRVSSIVVADVVKLSWPRDAVDREALDRAIGAIEKRPCEFESHARRRVGK